MKPWFWFVKCNTLLSYLIMALSDAGIPFVASQHIWGLFSVTIYVSWWWLTHNTHNWTGCTLREDKGIVLMHTIVFWQRWWNVPSALSLSLYFEGNFMETCYSSIQPGYTQSTWCVWRRDANSAQWWKRLRDTEHCSVIVGQLFHNRPSSIFHILDCGVSIHLFWITF